MSASILEHFSSLPDYRVDRHKLYPLPEILLLVVCAVLGGAEAREAMEEFGRRSSTGCASSPRSPTGFPPTTASPR
jgi:hypothetical protein